MNQREGHRMTESPEGKPAYRTLTVEEFARLPNAEFCNVVESISSDLERNEDLNLIRMLAVSDPDGDLKDIVKKLTRTVEAMRWAFRLPD
jgi:hypothetical protein